MRALPEAGHKPAVYLPPGTAWQVGDRLRREGWRTVAGVPGADGAKDDARRLGCSHMLVGGAPAPLAAEG